MDVKVAEEIEKFFTQFRFQKYKKGEILIQAEQDPGSIFYLKSGLVKHYAISKKGDELVLNIYTPVAFFPMTWAINQSPNHYYWEAVSDVEVWKAPADEVVTFVKENPDVLFDLLSRVYRGTDGLITRMAYLMSGSAYTRLITELIIHAKRFGKKEENGMLVTIEIAEKDLATRAGMTRETISREMKNLKDKGLVSFQKNLLIVHNIDKLEEELAGDI